MNIFICYTPLHVLISKKIIETEKIKNYIFIYFSGLDSEKNRFYYDKLALKADKSFFIVLTKKIPFDFWKLFKLYWKLKRELSNENNFFSGSIKSFYTRVLLLLFGFKTIKTFDDGSGNISGSGYFYDLNEKWMFSKFFSFFDKKLLYKNIKNLINIHYTIYKLPNVFQNTKYIEVFDFPTEKQHKEKKITVLLTNAFAEDQEMTITDEIELYEKVVEQFNVTHIIRHPREKYTKISSDKVQEISSPLIAEELLSSLAKEYKVEVLGMYSSVLVNLMDSRIKILNIHADLKKPLEGLKEILKDSTIYV